MSRSLHQPSQAASTAGRRASAWPVCSSGAFEFDPEHCPRGGGDRRLSGETAGLGVSSGCNAKLSIVEAASICDGIIKGLKHPEWPLDPWAALKRLMLLTMQQVASAPAAPRGTATPRLQLVLNA